jgi:adenylate kinase
MGSRFVLLGPPGAGKGTQSAILSERRGIPVVATGNIFRYAIANETTMGKQVAQFVHSGLLVPDELANAVVADRLGRDDCQNGFILDGYPRSIGQAEAFDIFLQKGRHSLDRVLYFKVEPSVVSERMGKRRVCRQCGTNYNLVFHPPKVENICDRCGAGLMTRTDDRPETIQSRLAIYEKTTRPLLEYYERTGILRVVHASKTVPEVSQELQKYCDENG